MEKYICDVCGYVHDVEKCDPENDVAPGTTFEELPYVRTAGRMTCVRMREVKSGI